MRLAETRPEMASPTAKGSFATDSRGRSCLLGFVLIVATLAVYLPVHHHPFFDPDDSTYLTDNAHVQKGLDWQTIHWALTTQRSYWHPLTWLVHAVAWQLFGMYPSGHHDVNVVFHAVNALVLFWMLKGVTGYTGRSFMVAALWVVHPMNVETVAFIAECKTLLCTLFCLLALAAYRRYALEPQNTCRWMLVAFLFLLALMSKPLAVILPAILLLWDYWPLRRMLATKVDSAAGVALPTVYPPSSILGLLKEKLSFLFLSVIDMLNTVSNQGVMHSPHSWLHPISTRIENATVAYVRYIGKAIWPFRLAPFYPYPRTPFQALPVLAAVVLLLVVSVMVAHQGRRRYLTVGWLWFLGVLFLNIGVVQLGDQAMADRYAYLSFIGLFLMICWGAAEWAQQRNLPTLLLPTISAIILLALTGIAHRQVGFWSDETTLWTHTLQVTQDNVVAEYRLGLALAERGKSNEAIPHFYHALALDPLSPAVETQMGIYERGRRNLPAAIGYFERALRLPDNTPLSSATALVNLGYVYRELGDSARASECFKQAAALVDQQEKSDLR